MSLALGNCLQIYIIVITFEGLDLQLACKNVSKSYIQQYINLLISYLRSVQVLKSSYGEISTKHSLIID